jgi:glycosyltransferase involved in cell wall biosynthesis
MQRTIPSTAAVKNIMIRSKSVRDSAVLPPDTHMDCLAFAVEPWEKLFGCREAVLSRLARNHKLLLAGPPNYFSDLTDARRRKALPKGGVTLRRDQFYTLATSKYFFTSDKLPLWDRVSRELRIRQIRRAVRELQFGPLALFLWHPMFASMLGGFDECVSCYYVYDHFAGFMQSERDARAAEENEEKLLRSVDIVFATGAGLFAEKNKHGNAVNVPNGVDYDLFSQALSPGCAIPDELAKIPEPRLGYLGNVNEKVDLQILEYLAVERPHWSIVFVGSDRLGTDQGRKRFAALCSRPNVHLLGSKRQAALPGYLRGMNVCLIPYCMSGWAYFGCPLKLHEYLAGGKPVVASALPSVCEFDHVVSIAHDPAEWVAAVERTLGENQPGIVEQRLEVARANSWDRRLSVIESAITLKAAEKRKQGLKLP